MSTHPKFNEAKSKLITSAERVAGAYLLRKYGSAHVTGEPTVELTYTEGPTSSSFIFSGKITCFASDGLLNQVGVNMTVNENDIEVTSEDVQSNITNALNSAEEQQDVLLAALDGFRLTDDGTKYFKVSHADMNDSTLGIVGKNEYASSTNKVALLKGILKDAFVDSVISFTGEFKEPAIEKSAGDMCRDCQKGNCDKCNSGMCNCDGLHHKQSSLKEAALTEEKPIQPKASSWLTSELLKIADTDELVEDVCKTCDNPQSECKCGDKEASFTPVAINKDVPLARSADTLVQAAQVEDQANLEAQLKVEHEAANELMSLLQGMGYGTAKTIEVTSSKDGVDVMTAIDHEGAVKAVSIPVAVKEGKIVLPKKSLISTLIAKGLDVKAKLMEQFDADVLEKLAAVDEKVAYTEQEVEALLNWRPVQKEANEGKNTMFEGDTDTLTVQKHLLPNHEDLKLGDRLSDGSDQWEIVNQGGQQNSQGEGDSSLWTMKKVQAPARDDKEPKNKIPS